MVFESTISLHFTSTFNICSPCLIRLWPMPLQTTTTATYHFSSELFTTSLPNMNLDTSRSTDSRHRRLRRLGVAPPLYLSQETAVANHQKHKELAPQISKQTSSSPSPFTTSPSSHASALSVPLKLANSSLFLVPSHAHPKYALNCTLRPSSVRVVELSFRTLSRRFDTQSRRSVPI